MWTNNSVGRYAKIFQPATVSPSTDNCWCIHAGVCQHVQWVGTAVSTLRDSPSGQFVQLFFYFFLTRQVPHPCTPQHTGMRGIFAWEIWIQNAMCCIWTPVKVKFTLNCSAPVTERHCSSRCSGNLHTERRSTGALSAFLCAGQFCSSSTPF